MKTKVQRKKRGERVNVWLLTPQKETLRAEARRRGLSLSGLLKSSALEKINKGRFATTP